jgi:hypothetical protein
VLAALKAKPYGRREGAGLDRYCARSASSGVRRDEETPPTPNKETGHLPRYQSRPSVLVIDNGGFRRKALHPFPLLRGPAAIDGERSAPDLRRLLRA